MLSALLLSVWVILRFTEAMSPSGLFPPRPPPLGTIKQKRLIAEFLWHAPTRVRTSPTACE
jgi:hypothetical protein